MFYLVFMVVYLKHVLCELSVGSKVLCVLIKLVCSGISLITTQDCLCCTWKAVRWSFMWHNSLFSLFNHWMYYINLGRMIPQFEHKHSSAVIAAASRHHSRIHTSQSFGPHHVAQEPLGAAARLLAASALSITAWGDALFSSHSSAAAYTNLFKQIFLLKHMGENMLCVRYTAVTQTRCLVSLDVFCSHGCWAVTLTGISIYMLKDIHTYFFSSGRCYVATISFLSAGARIVCSVRRNSCSVLPDRGIKNGNFSTALTSSCLNMAYHTLLGFWCHLSNLLS